jgi:molybdopterin/thiamine biosynthesis adenylyltransferase
LERITVIMSFKERLFSLSEAELERYRRQLMLYGFNRQHQQKLKDSTALIAGIGGLGGTAALYLAVAGIGKLVLAHYGNLTLSNMNRQILMKDHEIGKTRVVLAKRSIQDINPFVEVEIRNERISHGNTEDLLRGADIALSARPNFSERRILNEYCVAKDVRMIEGAMNGMEGYIFNVVPGISPCLQCVYPEDNPQWQELGFPVLGAVSGMLGCLMAIEAIKLLTGFGRPIISEMLVFDLIDQRFTKLGIKRDVNCPVCGKIV